MLGEALQAGELRNIVAVPTSQRTADHAQALGIPLITLDNKEHLDLVVDGADEVDPDLNLIKGLGQALLREKIVEVYAECFLVVVDESKLVRRLGSQNPLPVEIVPFGAEAHVRWLQSLACRAELWRHEDGSPLVTDNGNYLARLWFGEGIPDPYALADTLSSRPGILEHGLFLDMTSAVIVAGADGVRVLTPQPPHETSMGE
jgi:ribose 5-phosphate isomerase A